MTSHGVPTCRSLNVVKKPPYARRSTPGLRLPVRGLEAVSDDLDAATGMRPPRERVGPCLSKLHPLSKAQSRYLSARPPVTPVIMYESMGLNGFRGDAAALCDKMRSDGKNAKPARRTGLRGSVNPNVKVRRHIDNRSRVAGFESGTSRGGNAMWLWEQPARRLSIARM